MYVMQVKVIFMARTKSAACCYNQLHRVSCKVAVRWVVKLIENMDISLKSRCNRSSNRSFLSYRNVHKSEMDYQKNLEQGLGSIYQFQDGGRSECKVEFELKIGAGFKSGIHHHKEVCCFNRR